MPNDGTSSGEFIEVPSPDESRFRSFVAGLQDDTVVRALAETTGLGVDDVAHHVHLAVGESAQTLRLLAGISLPPSARVLEVGAGLGLTSAFLASIGLDVTALEPGGQGFEPHAVLASAIADRLSVRPALLTVDAGTLTPAGHGRFDLVFSNNVVEHIVRPEVALAAMRSVTAVGGWCVHSCPNYHVPFEPHFGVPLLPVRPAATARVLPRRIREHDIWASLNFITSSDVERVARDVGGVVHFRPAALAGSIERLATDAAFAERHAALARVAKVGRRLGVVWLARRLPASWSTPMHFVLADDALDPAALARWAAS